MTTNGHIKRTKPPQNGFQALSGEDMERIQALSVLTSRLKLAGNLGMSHGGERDLYGTLGYPLEIKTNDLVAQWKRQDIARAIVDRPTKATWQGDIAISEPEQEDKTDLEQAFSRLDEKIKLKSKLLQTDRLAQLGDYAVLLLGFDDSDRTTWSTPVSEGERDLMYVRPVSKDNAEISIYETDASNPRFGLPRIYKIDISSPEGDVNDKTKNNTLKVHYSRVIHVAYDLLEDDVEGNPIMKAVYNRLKDLEKLVGGSAEMFWRGARPGYSGSAKDDYKMDATAEKDLRSQLDEYEHNLRRFIVSEGIDLNSLEQQISDPSNHFTIQIQALSAATNIPMRVLVGSERGELASTQDKEVWNSFIHNRRTEEVEPTILRPLIDRLIKHKVLPGPIGEDGYYSVIWSDLFKLGEKEKSDIGKSNAAALKQYASAPAAEQMIPLEAFLRYFLKLDDDTVTQVMEMSEAQMEELLEEEAAMEELEEEMEEVDDGSEEETEPEPEEN